jgi:predicted nucleic acid-binding protein
LSGYTFDAGALIALERGKLRMRRVFETALDSGAVITVPAVVLTEWWRGQRSASSARVFLTAFVIEESNRRVCMDAGEAIAAVRDATAIDAIVMASAARRGDVVYTSDIEDLQRLQAHFKGVPRVLRA